MPWLMLQLPLQQGTGRQQRLSVQRRHVLRQQLRLMLCGVLLSRAELRLQLLTGAWLACRCVLIEWRSAAPGGVVHATAATFLLQLMISIVPSRWHSALM
jgi:hypothetical protein